MQRSDDQFWADLSWARAGWLLVFGAALVLFTDLGVRELFSGDETRVAGIAAAMADSGDWLIPRLNGTPFLEYPPFYYWLDAAAFRIFGVGDWAAKLPSALAAFGAVMVVFAWARRLGLPPWGAWAAGMMLAASAQFFGNGRKCMVDMVLAFFILLAVFSFWRLMETAAWRRKAVAWLVFALSLTGGVMTKGMVGLILPLAVLGVWRIGADVMARKLRFAPYFYLGFGLVAALGLTGIWYGRLYVAGGENMLHEVLVVNNLGRFSGSQGDHLEPWFYYLGKLPSLFLPWLPLLVFAAWHVGRRVWQKQDAARLLVLLFMVLPFLIFSVAAGKRVVYLLPIYAPAALLCADWLSDLPQGVRGWLARRSSRWAWVGYGVLAAAIVALAVLSAGRGVAVWGAVAALVLAGLAGRRYHAVRMVALVAALALGTAAADGVRARFENADNSLRGLFDEIGRRRKAGQTVVLASAPERTRGGAYYYLGTTLPEVKFVPSGPAAGEIWVIRAKRMPLAGQEFADNHILITGKKGACHE